MLKSAFVTALLLAPAVPAVAQDVYEIDPAHTQVVFSVDRFGFTTIYGSFMESGGTITIDADNPENSSVSAQVDTGTVFLGNATRDEHVAGEYWLNAGTHPQISFESTQIVLTSENTADVQGQLSMLGETREVTLQATLNRMGTDPATQREAVGFTITGTIDRTDWGNNTATAIIGTDVGIRIETLAHLRAE